jgi:hypothetical protein
MRLIRILPAFALVGTALTLAAPTAGSAATLPTPTRIVLFTGGGNATPVGPATQPAGRWTLSTAPAKITTTNYGTLVEGTGLGPIGACAAQCGEWWYDPRPSWVQLAEFYWHKTNGTQVLATNLVPALANNNEWASLGNGTYTPPVPVVGGDVRHHVHAAIHQAEPDHPRVVEDQCGRTEHLLGRPPPRLIARGLDSRAAVDALTTARPEHRRSSSGAIRQRRGSRPF